VWRVDRPGYEPALGHISDRALNAYQLDAYLYNNGTVGNLAEKVINLLDTGRINGPQEAHNEGVRA
jgi:hypothetical protein